MHAVSSGCSLTYPSFNAYAPIILSPVAGPVLQYLFVHLILKRHDFRKDAFGHKMCIFISSINLSEILLTVRKAEQDMNINVYWPPYKIAAILSDF
jgi:hypothetical protein